MNRHPLIAALLAIVLTLQLSLVGGGAACTTAAGDSATAAGSAMAGMTMPEMPSDRHSSDGDHSAPPCERSIPAASCQSMALCLSSIAALPMGVRDLALAPGARVDAGTAVAPPSRTTAPELPPPRA